MRRDGPVTYFEHDNFVVVNLKQQLSGIPLWNQLINIGFREIMVLLGF